jgi:hypothetical protein
MPCPYGKREWSNVVFVEAVDEVGAGADGDGHHGESGILAGGGDEAGAVHDENVFDVVGLIKWSEHGFLGIGAHAGGA